MYLAKILITLLIFFSFGGDQINELVMTEKIRNNFSPLLSVSLLNKVRFLSNEELPPKRKKHSMFFHTPNQMTTLHWKSKLLLNNALQSC